MHDGGKGNRLNLKAMLNIEYLAANAQKVFLIGALLFVVVIMSIMNPRFLSLSNLINIGKQMSTNLIIAVGMTFCIISGGIDLSVGSVGIMAGCLTGLLLSKSFSIPVAVAIGILAGTAFGLINGFVIAKFKILPFIGTLGTMTTARGVALLITGGNIISGLPDSFNFIGVGFLFGIPVPVIIMLVVIAVGHIILSKTEFGLNTYAIGGNAKAAKLAGLKNESVIMKIYMLSGTLAALSGIILTARVISAQPSLMTSTNLDVVAAVVVGGSSMRGGVGNMGNTILGSIFMASLYNGLNIIGLGYEWQSIIIGGIVVIAVILDTVSRRHEV